MQQDSRALAYLDQAPRRAAVATVGELETGWECQTDSLSAEAVRDIDCSKIGEAGGGTHCFAARVKVSKIARKGKELTRGKTVLKDDNNLRLGRRSVEADRNHVP